MFMLRYCLKSSHLWLNETHRSGHSLSISTCVVLTHFDFAETITEQTLIYSYHEDVQMFSSRFPTVWAIWRPQCCMLLVLANSQSFIWRGFSGDCYLPTNGSKNCLSEQNILTQPFVLWPQNLSSLYIFWVAGTSKLRFWQGVDVLLEILLDHSWPHIFVRVSEYHRFYHIRGTYDGKRESNNAFINICLVTLCLRWNSRGKKSNECPNSTGLFPYVGSYPCLSAVHLKIYVSVLYLF